MTAKNALISGRPRHYIKVVTFDGTARNGAVGGGDGQVLIARVTGRVVLLQRCIACTTSLVSAGGGTVQFGSVTNSTFLCLQTTATDLVAGTFWKDTTPEVEVGDSVNDQLSLKGADATGLNDHYLLMTVGTAEVTAGSLEFVLLWRPMSPDGMLSEPPSILG